MGEPDLTGQLALPNDVVMTPVADLAPEVRRRFASKDGDVVLSRLGTRVRSCVIDASGADLLTFFRSPTRIVDAIVRHCQDLGLDPRETLIAAFPMFRALAADGLLVGAEDSPSCSPAPLLSPGYRFDWGTVVRCIRHLDDTEVYEVELSQGRRAALKIGTSRGAPVLTREAQFLRALGGSVAPRLLAEPAVSGNRALLIEWCEGTSCTLFASSLRLDPGPAAQRELFALCRRVATAYAELHSRGVIHGDVHPDNLCVADDGTVRILDFGLARRVGERDSRALPRGAVWFFLAPECARRLLDTEPFAAPTARSEQYAVAALLYLLWTGEHYLEFKLGAREMLRQIRDRPPRPFAALASASRSPVLERVIRRALAKDPRRRFSSIRALASEIIEESHVPATPSQRARASTFVQATLRSCRLNASLARSLPPPTASVYYGAAGVALALLRIARARQSPDVLALSDAWCLLAEQELRGRRGLEWSAPDLGAEVAPVTPYHRGSGVALVRSAISYGFGDGFGAASARRLFVRRAKARFDSPDLTLGYGGVLAAAASLLEQAGRGDASLVKFGDSVANRLVADIRKLGVPGRSSLATIGMAHGWAGLLYALLRWRRVRERAIEAVLLESLHRLADIGRASKRGRHWPVYARPGSSTKALDSAKGWCAGSAGMVLLWTEAAAVTAEPKFWRMAEQAGRHCQGNDGASFNLCCGLTGRAYSLLVLARESRDPTWQDRARDLASLALRARRAGVDGDAGGYPRSLFRGDLGLAMLLVELEGTDDMGFPFVERL